MDAFGDGFGYIVLDLWLLMNREFVSVCLEPEELLVGLMLSEGCVTQPVCASSYWTFPPNSVQDGAASLAFRGLGSDQA